ncbi:MAG: CaiB/BaiF CoA transferase family protein [Acidimicrobiales bacterium]
MNDTPILDGIRVVDMTQYLAGPTVTRLMAEMGADIVKIEQAPHGDPSRSYAIVNDGRSGYFVQQNRGKRSLCIDFDKPDGRVVLDALIAKADILVENYGPGVLERRGLDWESLHVDHPRLIMASVSGYGRSGAYNDRTAFDLIAQAQSGIMYMTGPADGPPMPAGTSIGDVGAGVHATAAIGFALYHRERTGRGQHLDIAMVDSLFHMHELGVQGPPLTGMKWRPTRSGHRSPINAPMGAFEGRDGWIVIQVMERQWPPFCEAIGRAELESDPRFADLRGRQKNRDELNGIVDEWLMAHDSVDHALVTLENHRVPSAKIIEPIEALDHPHYLSREMVRRVPDPVLGEVVVPGMPLRFSEQPELLELRAPLLGEHNGEVLAELGYEPSAVADLEGAGVLGSGSR